MSYSSSTSSSASKKRKEVLADYRKGSEDYDSTTMQMHPDAKYAKCQVGVTWNSVHDMSYVPLEKVLIHRQEGHMKGGARIKYWHGKRYWDGTVNLPDFEDLDVSDVGEEAKPVKSTKKVKINSRNLNISNCYCSV